MVSATSTACASQSGLPLSSTSMVASSSACCSSRSARSHNRRARRVAGTARQLGNALRAAPTASPTSRSVASGASASTSPVAGFTVGSRPAVVTNSPPMYRRNGRRRKSISGLTTVVISMLPCLPSLAANQLEDLPPEHGSLAQRGERLADALEWIPAGHRHDHGPLRRQTERVLEV